MNTILGELGKNPKFKEYIKELTYACIDKDVEKIRALLREVSDKDISLSQIVIKNSRSLCGR